VTKVLSPRRSTDIRIRSACLSERSLLTLASLVLALQLAVAENNARTSPWAAAAAAAMWRPGSAKRNE